MYKALAACISFQISFFNLVLFLGPKDVAWPQPLQLFFSDTLFISLRHIDMFVIRREIYRN